MKTAEEERSTGGKIEEGLTLDPTRLSLRRIEVELKTRYFEREDIIRGLLIAALSRQHVLLLGMPGTAKSKLLRDLCQRITGANFFQWLLSAQSPVEEINGPVSATGLMNDVYRRITTNKLPEAHVAFLDEPFKCNSSTLNALLSILNERLFFNDGKPTIVPLEFAVGASNEFPQEKEELAAFYDRFLLRYIVDYVRDDKNFEAMLKLPLVEDVGTVITLPALTAAQAEARNVKVDRLITVIRDLRRKLKDEDGILISDRRWRESLMLIRANAWLEGHAEATEDDLEILAPVLWQSKEQIVVVRQKLMMLVSPLNLEAQNLLDGATDVYDKVRKAKGNEVYDNAIEAVAKFNQTMGKLEELITEAEKRGKSPQRIKNILTKVQEWNDEMLEAQLGASKEFRARRSKQQA